MEEKIGLEAIEVFAEVRLYRELLLRAIGMEEVESPIGY
jgi:hypothetical protein